VEEKRGFSRLSSNPETRGRGVKSNKDLTGRKRGGDTSPRVTCIQEGRPTRTKKRGKLNTGGKKEARHDPRKKLITTIEWGGVIIDGEQVGWEPQEKKGEQARR